MPAKKAKKVARKLAKKKAVVRRKDIERPYCDGEWTNSRFFGFIRSSLRNASSRWNPARTVLKEAAVGARVNKSSGRVAMHFRCAICLETFPRKQVEIDHILEVGSLSSFQDLPGFAERLFCNKDGYRVLCRGCHASRHAQPS